MPFGHKKLKLQRIFNKSGLDLEWPRIWIFTLGLILIFLSFSIAGMEIGHTMFDLYRSTAFGGFIVFIPLILCSIFVLTTSCKTNLTFVRITVILCCIMIILCTGLIAYDILVLIDPTRCFFLNCNDASVTLSNSTSNLIVTGWPLYITWPDYFQTNMNAKRIFQGIQLLCAALFILFSSFYLLIYAFYRYARLTDNEIYTIDHHTFIRNEIDRASPGKSSNSVHPTSSQSNMNNTITTYMIEEKAKTFTDVKNKLTNELSQTSVDSKSSDRLCTRCNRESRMMLVTIYEKQTYFPNLCVNCNNEIVNTRRQTSVNRSTKTRLWRH